MQEFNALQWSRGFICQFIIVAKCKYAKFILIFENWMENQLEIHAHARF